MWESRLSGSERGRRSTVIWMKYCGTAAKAGGNGEYKYHPVVTEGSGLLERLAGRARREAGQRPALQTANMRLASIFSQLQPPALQITLELCALNICQAIYDALH